MLSRALPRSSRRSLRPRFLMERKGEALRCWVCWSVISDGHRDAGQSWKSLSSPLRAVSTHGRCGGRGAWSALLRVQKVEPSSPPLEWTHESPPPPPQNEVEVTACAWGGGRSQRTVQPWAVLHHVPGCSGTLLLQAAGLSAPADGKSRTCARGGRGQACARVAGCARTGECPE